MRYMETRELRETCSQYQLHLKTVAGHSHMYVCRFPWESGDRTRYSRTTGTCVCMRVTSSFFSSVIFCAMVSRIGSCGCVRGSPPTRGTLMPIKSVGESAYARQADLIYGACWLPTVLDILSPAFDRASLIRAHHRCQASVEKLRFLCNFTDTIVSYFFQL